MSRQKPCRSPNNHPNLGIFRARAARTGDGPGLASRLLRTAASVLCVALWSGCLVTDEISFNDEPDVTPVILNKPGFEPKIGGIVWIDTSVVKSWTVEVQIRDENIDEEDLAAHWRIRQDLNIEPDFVSSDVPPGEVVRDIKFSVSMDKLKIGVCQRLELVVSGSFYRNRTSPEWFEQVPAGREDDRAYASWWIWEGEPGLQDSDAAAILDSCFTSVAQPLPAQATEQQP